MTPLAGLRAWFAGFVGSEDERAVADALLAIVGAAREVDAFLDPKDKGAPWEFGGKRVSEESALALLSLHDYLNDLRRCLDA